MGRIGRAMPCSTPTTCPTTSTGWSMVGREVQPPRQHVLISRESVFAAARRSMPLRESMPITTTATNRTSTSRCSTSRANVALAEMDAHDLQQFYGFGGDPRLRLRAGRRPGQAGHGTSWPRWGSSTRRGSPPRPDVPDRQPPVRQGDDRLNPDYYTGKEFVIETTAGQHAGELLYRFAGTGRQTLAERTNFPFAEVVGGGTLRVNLAASPTQR